jgi:hypothetical protein
MTHDLERAVETPTQSEQLDTLWREWCSRYGIEPSGFEIAKEAAVYVAIRFAELVVEKMNKRLMESIR